MKYTLYFFALTLLFNVSIGSASATIFRVNNGLTENIPNKLFAKIQTAINNNSVGAGDTLMVESSGINYEGFTCNKKLTIIGPGYFLGENPGVNGVVASAKINDYCYFVANSQGSYLIGMELLNGLYLSTSNIYVMRSRALIVFYGSSNATISNCKITDSYCDYIGGDRAYNSNMSVTNCIIVRDASNLNYLNYDNNVLVGTYALEHFGGDDSKQYSC